MTMDSTLVGGNRLLEPRTPTGRKRGPVAIARERRDKKVATTSRDVGQGETVIALCAASPDSAVAALAGQQARALSAAGARVILCARHALPAGDGVISHVVDVPASPDPLEIARGFAAGVEPILHKEASSAQGRLGVLAYEWQSIPALMLSRGDQVKRVLSLQSLETQRSDMTSRMSLEIKQIERNGLSAAQVVILHDGETVAHAEQLAPGARARVHFARSPFPAEEYESRLDPGEVKARYAIGPVDPTVLYIGDMNHAHGPDILIKAAPAVLRNHPQARFVFVGDGDLLWPVRVMSRYMLLEHAVRIVGHVGGKDIRELIAASDIVVVPSRHRTEDWEILAAWAARRPVVATHEVADGLAEHERNAVLVYPNPGSVVWGTERVLYDHELAHTMADAGHQKLLRHWGWPGVAAQLLDIFRAPAAAANLPVE